MALLDATEVSDCKCGTLPFSNLHPAYFAAKFPGPLHTLYIARGILSWGSRVTLPALCCLKGCPQTLPFLAPPHRSCNPKLFQSLQFHLAMCSQYRVLEIPLMPGKKIDMIVVTIYLSTHFEKRCSRGHVAFSQFTCTFYLIEVCWVRIRDFLQPL